MPRVSKKACVVGTVTFPTSVISEDGTYVGAHKARAEVCRVGRGVTVTVHSPALGTIRLTKSQIQREATRYARLARTLPCPSARQVAQQLASEWRGFARQIEKMLRG